ncbi:putative hydratase [Gordonia aichiensis NBRC 108223]|uniref:Putative hydratase n=1 Tax=Gordonia aichiensis NBRC 108223 TaxID=1220583 RepID=L7KET1_9ACTN|nr:putative hydratase [Gordonia aichiensis NBRC 108223]
MEGRRDDCGSIANCAVAVRIRGGRRRGEPRTTRTGHRRCCRARGGPDGHSGDVSIRVQHRTGHRPTPRRPVGGPLGDAVGAIARRAGIAVLYGCAELDGSAVYNTVRLVDPNGISLASHRKTHLFGEVDRQAVAPGSATAPVIGLGGWSLGLLICYEVEFPEMVRDLAVRGAEVICVPTANMPEYDAVQTVLLPARALENTVFVVYANYCGREGDLAYGGLSEAIDPDGSIRARAGRDPELLIVDVERRVLDDSRERFTYLADRRPDSLS